MATLAFLAEQRLVSTEKLQKITFGLCRLEAWRLKDKIGTKERHVNAFVGCVRCWPFLLFFHAVICSVIRRRQDCSLYVAWTGRCFDIVTLSPSSLSRRSTRVLLRWVCSLGRARRFSPDVNSVTALVTALTQTRHFVAMELSPLSKYRHSHSSVKIAERLAQLYRGNSQAAASSVQCGSCLDGQCRYLSSTQGHEHQ